MRIGLAKDYYAALGVTPTTDHVVIRAAYLALMRRYHPDVNPSQAAAERTRAVIAAYKILGDPERRADYDSFLASSVGGPPPLTGSQRRTFGPAAFAVFVLLLMAGVTGVWFQRPSEQLPQSGAVEAVAVRKDRIAPNTELAQLPAPAPDQPAPALARPAPDVPAPSAVAPPQFVPAAPIPAPAQPARVPAPAAAPPAAAPAPVAPRARPSAPSKSFVTASVNCSFARRSWETAICTDRDLAGLDRHLALFYNQSWRNADAAKRERMARSGYQFVARRDECRSDTCVRSAYLERVKEVALILSSGAPAGANPQP
jgi:curved DNA-binding protein CbpA